jgi:hypothetical protein
MIAAATHLLSAWVAYVIFAVLWIGFAIWPKRRQGQTPSCCVPWHRGRRKVARPRPGSNPGPESRNQHQRHGN